MTMVDKSEQWADARAARQDGIARAVLHAGGEWNDYALEFVRRFLIAHPTMHTDELWEAGLLPSESDRALGGVVGKARDDGWIAPITSKKYDGVLARKSVRSRGGLKIVWRSLLHQPTGGPS